MITLFCNSVKKNYVAHLIICRYDMHDRAKGGVAKPSFSLKWQHIKRCFSKIWIKLSISCISLFAYYLTGVKVRTGIDIRPALSRGEKYSLGLCYVDHLNLVNITSGFNHIYNRYRKETYLCVLWSLCILVCTASAIKLVHAVYRGCVQFLRADWLITSVLDSFFENSKQTTKQNEMSTCQIWCNAQLTKHDIFNSSRCPYGPHYSPIAGLWILSINFLSLN